MARITDISPELTRRILDGVDCHTEGFRGFHGWDDRSATISGSRILSGSIVLAYTAIYRDYEATGSSEMFNLAGILRDKIRQEYPSVSLTDPGRIAYIRTPDHYELDRWTMCRIGAYINRLCPDIFGGRAMDTLVSVHDLLNGPSEIKFINNSEDRIKHMSEAEANNCRFGSCMAYPFHGKIHPYTVYSDRLGWTMAQLIQGGKVIARCLVNSGDYVRIYADSSRIIEKFSIMLRDAYGIRRVDSWEGYEVEAIRGARGEWVGPYVDGDCQTGTYKPRNNSFMFDESGDAEMCGQRGLIDFHDTDNEVRDHNGNWIPLDDALYYDGEYYGEDDQTWDDYNEEMIPSCYAMTAYNHNGDRITTLGGSHDFERITTGSRRGEYHHTDNVVMARNRHERMEYCHIDDVIYYAPEDADYVRSDCRESLDGILTPLSFLCSPLGGGYRLSADCMLVNSGHYADCMAHKNDIVTIGPAIFYSRDPGLRKISRYQYVYFAPANPPANVGA